MNARPIGIWNAAHSSSGRSKSSSHSDAAAGRAELGVARAQRPARLADADDPPLLEMQQVAVVLAEADRAQLAARRLAHRRIRGRSRPRPGRELAKSPGGAHASTATCTVPFLRSSGTGSSCSASSSRQRPARGRSNARPQCAQVSVPPSSTGAESALAAAGARVAVGEQRAGHVRDQQRAAGGGERPARERGDALELDPPALAGHRQRQPAGRRVALRRLDDALDLEPEQVRREVLERLLDRQLERARAGARSPCSGPTAAGARRRPRRRRSSTLPPWDSM